VLIYLIPYFFWSLSRYTIKDGKLRKRQRDKTTRSQEGDKKRKRQTREEEKEVGEVSRTGEVDKEREGKTPCL
jgi:hypothetical protein